MKRELYTASSLFIVVLSVLAVRFYTIDHSQTMEWGYVNAGAINPYYGTNPPLGFRPLMPVLLNLSGIVPKAGELFIPILSALIMCMVFYVFLRVYGMPSMESAMGTVFLACSPGIPDMLKEFCINHVDTASHILILIALIGIIKENHTLFSLATVVGTFNREWALVLIPAWYLYHYGFTVSSKSILLLLRVTLPAAAVYWMVREIYFPNTAIGVMQHDLQALLSPDETATVRYYWQELMRTGLQGMYGRIVSDEFYQYGLIAFSPALWIYWQTADKRWIRLSLYYLLICLIQFAIAADVWRLSFYMFPVILTALTEWIYIIGNQKDRKTQSLYFILTLLLLTFSSSSIAALMMITTASAWSLRYLEEQK